jgi:hypothetical protein
MFYKVKGILSGLEGVARGKGEHGVYRTATRFDGTTCNPQWLGVYGLQVRMRANKTAPMVPSGPFLFPLLRSSCYTEKRNPREQPMKSFENCGVCGKPLVYSTEEQPRTCVYCGGKFRSQAACEDGHYVCDSCHSKSALDILDEVLAEVKSADPGELLETVMARPGVPMHGPEHHAMVPAVLVAAARNAGYPVPENAVRIALERGAKVPGGWCGSHGACAAGLGLGIAVSVLTGATPLKGEPRALANEATSFALGQLVDGGPRCCKRAARNAVAAATLFLKNRMNIELASGERVTCRYAPRNRECIGKACPYFDPAADLTHPDFIPYEPRG